MQKILFEIKLTKQAFWNLNNWLNSQENNRQVNQ